MHLLPVSLLLLAISPLSLCRHDQHERRSAYAFTNVLSTEQITALVNDPPYTTYLDWKASKNPLREMLIPRPPDTPNNKKVRAQIQKHFAGLVGWKETKDTFKATTPYGEKEMTNLIFTYEPDFAERRLVIAAHLDSKFFPTPPLDGFVGATDSAAPMALMLDLSAALTPLLKERASHLKSLRKKLDSLTFDENEDPWAIEEELDIKSTSLEFIFFDGEEAYKDWTNTDSIYGAKHLAQTWSKTYLQDVYPRRQSPRSTMLTSIENFVLLDLLGAPKPQLSSFYEQTGWLYDEMRRVEGKLLRSGGDVEEMIKTLQETRGGESGVELGWEATKGWFTQRVPGLHRWGAIEDDHIPFIQRGVPILHVIPAPFPSVWHTIDDNGNALDLPTLIRWSMILRVFTAEYLGLSPLQSPTRSEQATKTTDDLRSATTVVTVKRSGDEFPIQFLSHPLPLMFVSGLDFYQTGSNFTSPNPAAGDAAAPGTEAAGTEPDDPFQSLSNRLKEALATNGGRSKSTIWDPPAVGKEQRKLFQILVVDNELKLPPSKIAVNAVATPTQPVQYRSPLSPLTPSSPLHPDGIIAPIWIRKHTELTPSVVVYFIKLPDAVEGDDELVNVVKERKRILTERGIKLTVVLVASRELLEDPTLDPRLSTIRRQSLLDSRASLFVLTPVSNSELADFLKSLQEVLWEPSLDYYLAHAKRVRRKRAKRLQGSWLGWTVRDSYKLGFFEEIRCVEIPLARRYYSECHESLVTLFSSTSLLPPRTKRWAEAKVLADSLCVKICKLWMYEGAGSEALKFFRAHLHVFEVFSIGWGIGGDTFEWWSWVGRQYRVFAELLELTLTNSSLPFPSLPPSAQSSALLNPSSILYHPSFYFYSAATCTVRRKEAFQRALTEEKQSGFGSGENGSNSPGFEREKEVQHSPLIIELYTKSYELFKKSSSGNSKMLLLIALKIAEEYVLSAQYELAVRFFEKISKSLSSTRNASGEAEGIMMKKIRKLWAECAGKLGDADRGVKICFEEMAHSLNSPKEHAAIQAALLSILKTHKPSAPEQSLKIDLSSTHNLVSISPSFFKPTFVKGTNAPFQVVLSVPSESNLTRLPVKSLTISIGQFNVQVDHSDSIPASDVQYVKIQEPISSESSIVNTANLKLAAGARLVIGGEYSTASSDVEEVLQISQVSFSLKESDWDVDLKFNSASMPHDAEQESLWLTSIENKTFIRIERESVWKTTVLAQPHSIAVDIEHEAPAYLDERYPITITVTNTEKFRDFDVYLDVLLHPSDDVAGSNVMTLDGQTSSSTIKRIPMGTLSANNGTSTKTLHLQAFGPAGFRYLDISVQSHHLSSPLKFEEHITSLTLEVVAPFKLAVEVNHQPPVKLLKSLLDMSRFEDDTFDKICEVDVFSRVSMTGAWDIEVESMIFHHGENSHIRLCSSSLSSSLLSFPSTWKPSGIYAVSSVFEIAAEENTGPGTDGQSVGPASPGWYEITWKRSDNNDALSTSSHTRLPIPPLLLHPPTLPTFAVLVPPTSAHLHEPFIISVKFFNLSPSHAASLHVHVDSSDAFVWSGARQLRLPMLLPGQSDRIEWQCVPTICGVIRLPRVRVWEAVRPQGGDDEDTEARMVEVKLLDGRRSLNIDPRDNLLEVGAEVLVLP